MMHPLLDLRIRRILAVVLQRGGRRRMVAVVMGDGSGSRVCVCVCSRVSACAGDTRVRCAEVWIEALCALHGRQ